jgi:hypothetical protein
MLTHADASSGCFTGPEAAAGAAGYTGPEEAAAGAAGAAGPAAVAAGLVTLDLRFRLALALELTTLDLRFRSGLTLELTKPLPSALRQLLRTPPPVLRSLC